MRIIGNIPHQTLKITVFKMENRLSVKLEDGLYEQTFKFRIDDRIQTLEDIKKIIDPLFIQKVEQDIALMHQLKTEAIQRNLPPINTEEFDLIL